MQERSQLESAAAARLEAAEASAAAHADALRSKLEGRIAAIASRLGQLAAQEETREKKRQELAAQVTLDACLELHMLVHYPVLCCAPGDLML